MSKHFKPIRILSVDPGTRDMGLALFEGHHLVRYWVRGLRKENSLDEVLKKGKLTVLDLLEKFRPSVLVMGKITHPSNKKNPVLKKLVGYIKLLARKKRIRLYEYDPAEARGTLLNDQRPTKRNVAQYIASFYPELSEYIPRERRILWRERDFYWANVFDACTLALAYLKKEGAGRHN